MTKADAVDANVEQFAKGTFEQRAARTVSNAKLYDLVQDMGHALDFVLAEVAEMKDMLKLLVERSHAKI